MNCVIQPVMDPDDPRWESVRHWLREHNWAVNGPYMQKWQSPENAPLPLNLLATEGGVVVGGLLAETHFAWLKIALVPRFWPKRSGSPPSASAATSMWTPWNIRLVHFT